MNGHTLTLFVLQLSPQTAQVSSAPPAANAPASSAAKALASPAPPAANAPAPSATKALASPAPPAANAPAPSATNALATPATNALAPPAPPAANTLAPSAAHAQLPTATTTANDQGVNTCSNEELVAVFENKLRRARCPRDESRRVTEPSGILKCGNHVMFFVCLRRAVDCAGCKQRFTEGYECRSCPDKYCQVCHYTLLMKQCQQVCICVCCVSASHIQFPMYMVYFVFCKHIYTHTLCHASVCRPYRSLHPPLPRHSHLPVPPTQPPTRPPTATWRAMPCNVCSTRSICKLE
jgi:hypothetical protein